MLGLMSITAFLSMWISNIASTSLMLPIVYGVLEHLSKTEAEDKGRELQQSSSITTLQVQEGKDKIGNIRT